MRYGRSRHLSELERRRNHGEPEFWVITEHEGSDCILSLYGELDVASAPILEKKLKRRQWSGTGATVLDLSGLDFVDSAGLNVLIRASQRSSPGGLSLLRGSRNVHRVFELTGMDTRLPFVD